MTKFFAALVALTLTLTSTPNYASSNLPIPASNATAARTQKQPEDLRKKISFSLARATPDERCAYITAMLYASAHFGTVKFEQMAETFLPVLAGAKASGLLDSELVFALRSSFARANFSKVTLESILDRIVTLSVRTTTIAVAGAFVVNHTLMPTLRAPLLRRQKLQMQTARSSQLSRLAARPDVEAVTKSFLSRGSARRLAFVLGYVEPLFETSKYALIIRACLAVSGELAAHVDPGSVTINPVYGDPAAAVIRQMMKTLVAAVALGKGEYIIPTEALFAGLMAGALLMLVKAWCEFHDEVDASDPLESEVDLESIATLPPAEA